MRANPMFSGKRQGAPCGSTARDNLLIEGKSRPGLIGARP
jgi:hypothetical protein